MERDSNAKVGALGRAGVSRDAVASIDRDGTLWAKDHRLCIALALCVGSEAKREKCIHSGDDGHHRLGSRQLISTGVYATARENAQGKAGGKSCTHLQVKRKERDGRQDRCAQRDVSRLPFGGESRTLRQSSQL